MADQLKDGLPRSSYAYAPSDDPATWKLPYLTADGSPDPSHLPGAAASFSPGGYRGEKVDIPAADMAAVKARLRQAYKKWKGSAVKFPVGIAESNPHLARAFETLVREDYGMVGMGCQGCGHPTECDCTTCPCAFHCDPSVGDAQMAATILSQLFSLKAGEAGETDELAMIDAAIAAVLKFIAAEAAEIGTTEETVEPSPSGVTEAKVTEAGARNAKSDQTHLNSAAEHAAHTLGHIVAAGGILPDVTNDTLPTQGKPAAEGITPKAADVAEAVIEAGSAAPVAVGFHESGGHGDFMVDFAEAEAVWSADGKEVWITPIRPGFGNQADGMYYPTETLKRAVQEGQMNNVKMFANHPSRSGNPLDARDVRDWVGTVKETVWDADRNAPRSRLRIYDQTFAERAHEAPDEIAFSLRGKGMARRGRVGGKDANVMESFSKVNSIDWVTEAGAGGAIAFAESNSEEQDMAQIDLDTLTLEQLKDGNPALYAAAVAEAAAAPVAPAVPATDPDLIARLADLEARDAARVEADNKAARGKANMALVREAVAATVLPGEAKSQVEAYFAESAADFADDDTLKAAVARQAKLVADTIAKFGGKPVVTGLGSFVSPSAPAPIAEAAVKLEKRMAGYTPAPTKTQLVFPAGSFVATPAPAAVAEGAAESGPAARLAAAYNRA